MTILTKDRREILSLKTALDRANAEIDQLKEQSLRAIKDTGDAVHRTKNESRQGAAKLMDRLEKHSQKLNHLSQVIEKLSGDVVAMRGLIAKK
jgi:GTP1/Obg family GTP-binding protein